jgi:serine/threonine protein kinase
VDAPSNGPDSAPQRLTSDSTEQEPWRNKWKPLASITPREGGHGKVHFVQSSDGKTKGALKLLKENLKAERRARMRREVVVLDTLKHVKGIPAVLDDNTSDFEDKSVPLYVVLQFVDGKNLSEHIHRPLQIDKAVPIAVQLCKIVKLCHESGVVHRDVKPDNIICETNSSQVWLVDFGQTWIEDDSLPFKTETDQEIGNRFLRLPELRSGSSIKDDQRSDLTFVCGVLFWLLTHERPSTLLDENALPPHRAKELCFPEDTKSDNRWDLIRSLFDVGFTSGINQRFQNADDLLERLQEISNPAPKGSVPNRVQDEFEKLLQFQARAEVGTWNNIRDAMMQASRSLVESLTELARIRNLSPGAAAPRMESSNATVFDYTLRLAHGDFLSTTVSHYIRLVEPNRSHVEAAFRFSHEPIPVDFLHHIIEVLPLTCVGLRKRSREKQTIFSRLRLRTFANSMRGNSSQHSRAKASRLTDT